MYRGWKGKRIRLGERRGRGQGEESVPEKGISFLWTVCVRGRVARQNGLCPLKGDEWRKTGKPVPTPYLPGVLCGWEVCTTRLERHWG